MNFSKGLGTRDCCSQYHCVDNTTSLLTSLQYSPVPSPQSLVPCKIISGIIIIFFLNLNVASCSSQKLPIQEIPIYHGEQQIAVVKAEIARTQEERNQGLMHRKTLKEGEGMLFVFDRDEILSFWMKNTLIHLSIAFITFDGRIVDIKDMYPGDLSPVSSSRSARYALEVPQGWFSRVGVQVGSVVKLKE